MGQLTFLSEAPPVSRSASPALEADWAMTVATWRSNLHALLIAHGPVGWCGRTSLESCHRTTEGILVPSSGRWQNSGMGSPTEFSTLATSESPSVVEGCSLSAVLETGELPPRFFLSARACRGYLRRLDKIMSAMAPGGLAKVEYLIASMRATAANGEATSGTPVATSSSDMTDDPAEPQS